MNIPFIDTLPSIAITAFGVQFLCQAIKVIIYSIKNKKFSMKYATSPGGMPSSHSAFVSALTFSIGFRNGFDSDIFAVALIFSGIVVYDAKKLRGTVEKQSILLNRIAGKLYPGEQVKLPEMVGHSFTEVLIGIIIGGFFGILFTSLLMRLEPLIRF